jgi:hypothetical protein
MPLIVAEFAQPLEEFLGVYIDCIEKVMCCFVIEFIYIWGVCVCVCVCVCVSFWEVRRPFRRSRGLHRGSRCAPRPQGKSLRITLKLFQYGPQCPTTHIHPQKYSNTIVSLNNALEKHGLWRCRTCQGTPASNRGSSLTARTIRTLHMRSPTFFASSWASSVRPL